MSNNPTDSAMAAGSRSPVGSADDCHAAMLRHYDRRRAQKGLQGPSAPVAPQLVAPSLPGGDILYGARAIALYLFPDAYAEDPRGARRRVFHLWPYYRDRKEKAGFLKLKGALCLSKTQWRAFHGLD
jgi:hypothetical protein